MEGNKISVIVPMYNASGCIDECLASIEKQTIKNLEIILVDDCSTDDTVEKASKFGFKVLSLKNRLTPAGVRNYGVKNSFGDLLVFVDADVVLKPNSIEEISRFLSAPDTEAVSGVYTQNTPVESFFSQLQNLILTFRYELAPKSVDLVCSYFCAIKRSAFEVVGGFNGKMFYYEDIEIGKRLGVKGYHCKIEPSLKVTHLKSYSYKSLMVDYFKKTAAVALYIKKEGLANKIKDNGWPVSIKITVLSSICLVFSLFLIEFTPILFLLFFTVYQFSSIPLLAYLIRKRNFIFGVKSHFVLFGIYLMIFAGFACGFLKKGYK